MEYQASKLLAAACVSVNPRLGNIVGSWRRCSSLSPFKHHDHVAGRSNVRWSAEVDARNRLAESHTSEPISRSRSVVGIFCARADQPLEQQRAERLLAPGAPDGPGERVACRYLRRRQSTPYGPAFAEKLVKHRAHRSCINLNRSLPNTYASLPKSQSRQIMANRKPPYGRPQLTCSR